MKANSLAFRWTAAAAVLAIVLLPIGALGLGALYRKEGEERTRDYIRVRLTVLVAESLDHSGAEPRPPRDLGEPLFNIAHSGWYWQVKPLDGDQTQRLVSKSLAGELFRLPSELGVKPDRSGLRWGVVDGPGGNNEKLWVAERIHSVGDERGERSYAYAVAVTRQTIDIDVASFQRRLGLSFAFGGLVLVLATLLPVRFALRPLKAIEEGLTAIRSGKAKELEGELPDEIKPLQQEINALLLSNQQIIERARTQVGNLAHALKTPLAVITNEAGEDKSPLAEKVRDQAALMRDQVNLYLERARMAARIGVIGGMTEVRPVAEGLSRALSRIYKERQVDITLHCPPDARFQGEKQDLEELLGNLLDNACKWAESEVLLEISVTKAETGKAPLLLVIVDDDGPGLAPELRQQAVDRGKRLDESKPGSGLGLSIVADLADLYRGSFTLGDAPQGGLRAELRLPAA